MPNTRKVASPETPKSSGRGGSRHDEKSPDGFSAFAVVAAWLASGLGIGSLACGYGTPAIAAAMPTFGITNVASTVAGMCSSVITASSLVLGNSAVTARCSANRLCWLRHGLFRSSSCYSW